MLSSLNFSNSELIEFLDFHKLAFNDVCKFSLAYGFVDNLK